MCKTCSKLSIKTSEQSHWCHSKIVYSFKSLTILARSSILRSVTGCWICLGYFFWFTIIMDLFSSPNILKYLMEWQLCTQTSVWQQGYHSNVCHFIWMFWLTLDRSLHFFLVLVLFTLTLFIVNVSLWHIFVENQKGIIFIGVVAKQFPTVPVIKLFFRDIWLYIMTASFLIFSIFRNTCSKSVVMRSKNCIFYILFYLIQ